MSVTELWPPNGRLVPETISGAVVDPLSGVDPRTVSFRVIDEYGRLQPAGSIEPGADGRSLGLEVFRSRLINTRRSSTRQPRPLDAADCEQER